MKVSVLDKFGVVVHPLAISASVSVATTPYFLLPNQTTTSIKHTQYIHTKFKYMPQEKYEGEGIEAPHDHDVLSGRGNFVNYHAGNEYFRALVRKYKNDYVKCPKPQKGKFSKIIVDEISARDPPGRFLKQDPSTKLWHDIGEKKSLDKTRQALREGAPDIMKELSGESGSDGEAEEDERPITTKKKVRRKILTEKLDLILAVTRMAGEAANEADGLFEAGVELFYFAIVLSSDSIIALFSSYCFSFFV